MTTIACRALLFDMDGTLVDSTAVVEGVWGRFSAEHGLDLVELLAFAHGRQTPDTLARFVPHLPADERARIAAHLESEEVEDLADIREIPGARALLTGLDDVPWAVVTSATRALAQRRMAACGFPPVTHLVPAEDVERSKPDPQGYAQAAARLGVDPRECVVFEDAPAGVRAGLAAGARVVVVGALADCPAAGLPHVPDLTGVRVRRQGDRLLVDLG